MVRMAEVAGVLQGLLTDTAEEIGRECQLIRRKREFTASSLLSTVVLGFLRWTNPKWEQLASLAREFGANVSGQAIEQRFTVALRDSLKKLWEAATKCVVVSDPRVVPLLQKFTSVWVGDSTTISLSDDSADQFPGCGGPEGVGSAAMKLQVVWDMISGRLSRMDAEPGKTNDSTSLQQQTPPPAGSLSLYDLGYFNLPRLQAWKAAGAHWITRAISDIHVWVDGQSINLYDWLNTQPPGPVDCVVEVGAIRLRCRVIALRATDEIASRRRQKAKEKAKKKGRTPTQRHLDTCDWTAFFTSCDADQLTWKEVVVLYRVRWQIELLFKLWKSHNLLSTHRSTDPVRQLAELYAKLTAALIQHWLVLTSCWSDVEVSLIKATRLLRDQLPFLIAALTDLERLTTALARCATLLQKLARIPKRQRQPSNPQLLANSELLTYTS